MVMDREALSQPMSEFDWQVLSHRYYKNEVATLPRRRLDIPLPSRIEERHTIAHRLAALSQAIGTAVRLASTTRSGVLEVSGLIEQARLGFKDLGEEWERELRLAEERSKDSAEPKERLRAVE